MHHRNHQRLPLSGREGHFHMASASVRLQPVLILAFPQNRNILLRHSRRSRQKRSLHQPPHPSLHHGFPGYTRTL